MEKRKVEVMVAPETNDVGVALAKIVTEAKKAVKDGFQPGTDISMIAIATFQPLMDALAGMEKIGGEFKEDKGAASLGLLLPLVEVIEVLMTEKEEQPAAEPAVEA